MRYGSVPAGGLGTRLQPLGFSKELAPVRGRAVIEYLLKRLVLAGVDKIFINTAADKTDLIRYLATKSQYQDRLIYLVRARKGLLDGITQPCQFLRDDDELYFGLPDTIWYPQDGFSQLDQFKQELVLGLFDTGTPEKFDSVVTNARGRIQSVEVKVNHPLSKWTWAIGKLSVRVARELVQLEEKHQLGPGEFGRAVDLYAQSHPAYACQFDHSHCLDIGSPESYARAEAFVNKHHEV